jgi:hypothetical protein
MSDLERFRDHCRSMAKPGAHRDTCHLVRPGYSSPRENVRPDPNCSGCVPPSDAALFERLADEADDYLARRLDDSPALDLEATP